MDVDLDDVLGQVEPPSDLFIGHITEQALAEIRADKVIMGARGVSLEHGLTNDYLQETLTDRAIIKSGRQVMIVADHTKINRVAVAYLAPLESMHTFVTDANVDKKFAQVLKKQGIQVVIA